MAEFELRWLEADDPWMSVVNELRHRVLFEPFGVERCERWDDEGPNVHRLAAMRGDEVLGYGCLIERDGKAQIRQLAIWPERQRTGLGSAIVKKLAARAADLGYPMTCLNSRVTAVGFYERLGFDVVSGEFPFGRTGMLHVRMERSLL